MAAYRPAVSLPVFCCIIFFLLGPSSSASEITLPSDSSKVSLTLYYESLCPYSANFIVNYLPKLFKDDLISIVDLRLVPWGNAKLTGNDTFSCQVIFLLDSNCVLNFQVGIWFKYYFFLQKEKGNDLLACFYLFFFFLVTAWPSWMLVEHRGSLCNRCLASTGKFLLSLLWVLCFIVDLASKFETFSSFF